MILLWAFVTSLIVAILRGGQISRLTIMPLRHGWIALLALAMQVSVIYFPRPRVGSLAEWHTLLLLGSYALLIVAVVLNRHLPGLPVISLGLGLNLLVMLANGGFMPITWEALEKAGLAHLALSAEPGARIMATKDVLLPREQTSLWWLSDVLVIGSPWPIRAVFSPGDMLLAAGAFWLLQRVMRVTRAVPVTREETVKGEGTEHGS